MKWNNKKAKCTRNNNNNNNNNNFIILEYAILRNKRPVIEKFIYHFNVYVSFMFHVPDW